jgi:NAD(P)H-dependent flavin oxidoreductase YrpB (nitropropane dioxygenase family)
MTEAAAGPFRTRITELFGIRHPILAGGLMWLSDARYVAAVVKAGGMGFMTSRSFATEAAWRTALEDCARLTGGAGFGVNLSTSRHTDVPLMAYLRMALAQGVRYFETAGRAPPEDLIREIRQAGGIVIHKVPLVRHALTAERLGVDAVTVVGMECGGHPGVNTEIPALLAGTLAARKLRIPFSIGGGIGTGRQLLAALAVGADAVTLGTRLVAAAEVSAHPTYKARVVASNETDTLVAFADNPAMGGAWRVLDNATARAVKQREAAGAREYAAFRDLIAGSLTAERCYRGGETEYGMVSLGPAACFVDRVEPMAAILRRLIAEAEAAFARLDAMRRAPPATGAADAGTGRFEPEPGA